MYKWWIDEQTGRPTGRLNDQQTDWAQVLYHVRGSVALKQFYREREWTGMYDGNEQIESEGVHASSIPPCIPLLVSEAKQGRSWVFPWMGDQMLLEVVLEVQ